jgi:hypothetical protein
VGEATVEGGEDVADGYAGNWSSRAAAIAEMTTTRPATRNQRIRIRSGLVRL